MLNFEDDYTPPAQPTYRPAPPAVAPATAPHRSAWMSDTRVPATPSRGWRK